MRPLLGSIDGFSATDSALPFCENCQNAVHFSEPENLQSCQMGILMLVTRSYMFILVYDKSLMTIMLMRPLLGSIDGFSATDSALPFWGNCQNAVHFSEPENFQSCQMGILMYHRWYNLQFISYTTYKIEI